MHTRTMYIPSDAKKIDFADDRIEGYVGTSRISGAPISMVFVGKAQKPTYHYRFNSVEEAFKSALSYMLKMQVIMDDRATSIAKRKEAKRVPHGLKVGDILYSTWGYDQTNVDFYQVIKLVGTRMVEYGKISSTHTYKGHMHGDAMPVKDSFITDDYEGSIKKRAVVDGRNNSIKVRSFANAYPWSGTPIGFSEWA